MKSIRVKFERFNDISLYNSISSIGCYVIWDSQAKAKSSYIGAGVILERLAWHDKRFSYPLDGYVAITENKSDALILEYSLICIAKETDRGAAYNGAPGHIRLAEDECSKFNNIKIYVSGFDPLLPVKNSKKLSSQKLIDLIFGLDGCPDIVHDWKSRKISKL